MIIESAMQHDLPAHAVAKQNKRNVGEFFAHVLDDGFYIVFDAANRSMSAYTRRIAVSAQIEYQKTDRLPRKFFCPMIVTATMLANAMHHDDKSVHRAIGNTQFSTQFIWAQITRMKRIYWDDDIDDKFIWGLLK